MHINEVESIVGLTKKSIRYYEEQGLLNPNRNHNNDYREYDEEDIHTLKTIKFLRALNVSIGDIKRLQDKTLTLKECMSDRIEKIEEEEKNYLKIKNMCEEIANNNISIDNLDINKYSTQMNILNKEGFTMKKKINNNRKKIIGAVISSITFSLFFLFFIGLFIYIQATEESGIPVPLFCFLIVVFGLPVIGIITNLIKRIIEIRGGEEDEASKY